MGISGRLMLFCVTCSCFFCSTEKVGYELPTSGDYIFMCLGGGTLGGMLSDKKMLLIRLILCYTMPR